MEREQRVCGARATDVLAPCTNLHSILTRRFAPRRQVVEKLRVQSKTEIYRTNIRNENAYYMCATQLLAVPDSLGGEMGGGGGMEKPIYVVGDSHTLSVGWRSIGGRVCVPMIVTGLKHWHLREGSEFYPKVGLVRGYKIKNYNSHLTLSLCAFK